MFYELKQDTEYKILTCTDQKKKETSSFPVKQLLSKADYKLSENHFGVVVKIIGYKASQLGELGLTFSRRKESMANHFSKQLTKQTAETCPGKTRHN